MDKQQSPLIELHGVVKHYYTRAGAFPALKGIDLEVHAGEFLGVIGKSGAGKSTLLNMVTGVDQLTEGQVIFRANGQQVSIDRLSENQLARWRGRTMGVVYQSFQLLPMLSLVQNVILAMDMSGLYQPRKSEQRARALLADVGLEDHADKLPSQISGGQQQRVAIARALANDPPLIVADEPTGSLDSVTADSIFHIFEKLIEAGHTILMVTHDRGLLPRFTRHIHIADGRVIDEGEADE